MIRHPMALAPHTYVSHFSRPLSAPMESCSRHEASYYFCRAEVGYELRPLY